MAPRAALDGREPQPPKLCRHRVHADLRIDQDMRRVVPYCLPPGIERSRSAHKATAQLGRDLGLGVVLGGGVIAEQAKALTVDHPEPALDRNLPVGMLPEEGADDANADRLICGGAPPA